MLSKIRLQVSGYVLSSNQIRGQVDAIGCGSLELRSTSALETSEEETVSTEKLEIVNQVKVHSKRVKSKF